MGIPFSNCDTNYIVFKRLIIAGLMFVQMAYTVDIGCRRVHAITFSNPRTEKLVNVLNDPIVIIGFIFVFQCFDKFPSLDSIFVLW